MHKRFKVVGINFDHFHMGDLLRLAHEHPDVEIVGISDEDPERMVDTACNFGIGDHQVFTDYKKCLTTTRPDLVILCPSAATHGLWTERVAPYGAHILIEKPFAGSLEEADRMAAVVAETGKMLAINWPLAWFAGFQTAKRLIDDGAIGEVTSISYYGGNRGPLYHGADKKEHIPTTEDKAASWFYKRSHGGGSLRDYMGYGTTLGTWLLGGRKPESVLCMSHQSEGLEVDEHSIAVAKYATGLARFETRWGTFTDPWTIQPQPVCGFVVCGTDGTLSIPDYASELLIQTRAQPRPTAVACDEIAAPYQNPIQYMVHLMATGEPVRGPLSVEISRIGQQIVDSAVLSAESGRAVSLLGEPSPVVA